MDLSQLIQQATIFTPPPPPPPYKKKTKKNHTNRKTGATKTTTQADARPRYRRDQQRLGRGEKLAGPDKDNKLRNVSQGPRQVDKAEKRAHVPKEGNFKNQKKKR